MAYSVDTYSGSRTFVVEDGTINTSLDIRLIGKNYAGYGEVQNENFLHLLENFAGIAPPPRPVAGQIWFDSNARKIKYWDASSSKWKSTGGTEVAEAANPPAGLSLGDLWWDKTNQQLFAYNGSGFVLIGPDSVGALGTTQMKSVVVNDTNEVQHPVIQGIVGDTIMFIVSEDTFTLGNNLTGFTVIKKGITLRDHNNADGTLTSGESTIFWGTASDTLKLGGYPASDYLRVANSATFGDPGFTVGDSNDLKIFIDTDGSTPVIRNQLGTALKFQTVRTSTTFNTPLTLSGANVLPGTNNETDLGSTTLKFKTVYATTFNGNGASLTALDASSLTTGTVPIARLSGTYSINIDGTATSSTNSTNATTATKLDITQSASAIAGMASMSPIAGTIALRTTTNETINGATITAGSLKANYFVGTATAALYADLAEKYLADQDYDVGTVVAVGGEKEVTAAQFGDRALGAVSANPAYMMNMGQEGGTYIALKGRVPVKVIGHVKKGDRLIAASNGVAQVLTHPDQRADVFAIALESSNDSDVKLVEAVIL